MTTGPRRKLPRGLAPLGIRNYALYWVGWMTSKLGRSIEETGAVWLVYEMTDSPILLGLLGIARAVPAVIASPIAGVLVDRVDQRRLLILMQTLGLIASATLGLLIISGGVQLWHVYVQIAIQGSVAAVDGSVRQALFPRLVDREQLPEAVTLSATAGRIAAIVGPMIGGIAIAAFGEAAPFLITAATYPVLMAAIALIHDVNFKPNGAGATFRAELTEGMAYIWRGPVTSGLLKLELVFGLFQSNAVMITLISREIFDVGPTGLGALLAAPALGALIGIAGLIGIGHPQRQGRFIVICTLLYAAAYAAMGFSPIYAATFVLLAVLGMLDSLATVTRHTVMQFSAPEHMRGRVMANMGTVTRGTSPLAETQSGLLTAILGPQLAVATAAGVIATGAVINGLRNSPLMAFRRTDAEFSEALADEKMRTQLEQAVE